jgi:CDP-diacylglycerol--serine O-phosphatidyltransferase
MDSVLLVAKQSWRNSKKRRFKKRHHPSPLPSVLTVLSLCFGLTSIKMALQSKWSVAIIAILIAAVLDGLDGRLARILDSTSRFGAELDSLADLVNFGVAPPLIIYLNVFGPSQESDIGWIAVLFFSTCMALRLARFNTYDPPHWAKSFSVGVPAPAGAFLCLVPLIIVMAFPSYTRALSRSFVLFTLFGVGGLLISRVPTFVLKNIKISHRLLIPTIVLAFGCFAFVYTLPWQSLLVLACFYVCSIPFSAILYRRKKQKFEISEHSHAPHS